MGIRENQKEGNWNRIKNVGVKVKLIEDLDSAEPLLLKSTYATKILNIIYSY